MPLTVDRAENHWIIRLEGEVGVAGAAELKALLLDALASTKELHIDLSSLEEADIPLLQLLWAAGSEALRRSIRIVTSMPETFANAARDAGFERFPAIVDQV